MSDLQSDELTICNNLHTLDVQKQQIEKQIDELVEKIVANNNDKNNSSSQLLNLLADLEKEETAVTEQWILTHK